MKNTLIFALPALIILFLAVLMIIGYVSVEIDQHKINELCKQKYPTEIKHDISPFKKEWGETTGIEEGYVKCCHKYYDNHEEKTRCKIFAK